MPHITNHTPHISTHHTDSLPAKQLSISTNPVLNTVQNLIKRMQKLPGITEGASLEAIAQHRNKLSECLDALTQEGIWSQQQEDQSVRPVAVGLQAIFEQALLETIASGDTLHADIIFTTANPMTPLCQPPGKGHSHPSLIAQEVANHSGSHDTVISRTHTVPQLLKNPQVNICALYSQNRADPEAQKFYESVCAENPDASRFYSLSSGVALPDKLSGANYVVVSRDNSAHLFGLRITQANNPGDSCVVFTKDTHNLIAQLHEGYLDAVLAQHPNDPNLQKFMDVLR